MGGGVGGVSTHFEFREPLPNGVHTVEEETFSTSACSYSILLGVVAASIHSFNDFLPVATLALILVCSKHLSPPAFGSL